MTPINAPERVATLREQMTEGGKLDEAIKVNFKEHGYGR